MYTYRIKKVNSVIDGDTIDCDIDLGFDISLNQRVRLAGIDTPESRTKDPVEKKWGMEAKEFVKNKLSEFKGQLIIKTEKPDSTEKYGRIIGYVYLGDLSVSLNETMVTEGYAWKYSGGQKTKDWSILESNRKK
jgi:micrococcal nuclease